ncbi:uncharacterized protein LOC119236834 [Talpa occidentalis]|uniref:uncharacterized protein LOC119236834 n=1 Tax=Talpa occidentalis TaxID=50954 RepID=UPI00188FE4C1|nr:uncharacterized protein LOC119236834 [Talpa occidentalis]
MVLMVMLVLGAGVWVWVKRKRKTGKGASWAAAPQALPPGEPAELQEYDVYSNTEAEYSKASPLRQPQYGNAARPRKQMFPLQLIRLTGSLGWGPAQKTPHLCRVTWVLGLTSLLLSTCSPGAQSSGVKDPGANLPLKGIRGSSVLFHVSKVWAAELEQTEWGIGPESDYRVFLRVHRGKEDAPTWVSLRDKYEQRVHVPNMTSLRMENLSPEDSGRYWARAQLTGGRGSVPRFPAHCLCSVQLIYVLKKQSSELRA